MRISMVRKAQKRERADMTLHWAQTHRHVLDTLDRLIVGLLLLLLIYLKHAIICRLKFITYL